MIRLLFSIVFLCSCSLMYAQYSRRLQPLYETEGGYYYPRGLHFAPGITYMLPGERNREIEALVAPDTLLNGDLKARGRVGLYLELGHAHFLPDWMVLDYIDYGASFKMLRGRENMDAILTDEESGNELGNFTHEASFSESFAGVYLNFGKFFQLSNYNFITASVGANADYRIISNRSFEGPTYLAQEFPDDLIIQAHLKIGYGIKLQENLFFIPAIETPILNAIPFENGKSTLPYFSSRYRPILLSLRFQWLTRKKPEDCVGKPSKPAGHQLWDPKMRRGK